MPSQCFAPMELHNLFRTLCYRYFDPLGLLIFHGAEKGFYRGKYVKLKQGIQIKGVSLVLRLIEMVSK